MPDLQPHLDADSLRARLQAAEADPRPHPWVRRAALVSSSVLVSTAAWFLLRPGPVPMPPRGAPPLRSPDRVAAAKPRATEPASAPTDHSAAYSTATSAAVPEPPLEGPQLLGCDASPATLLAADVDGDGCPESLRHAGGLLEAGDRRWQVGTEGDQIAIGDWWCTGVRTLAVLRATDGAVFAFPGWPAPDDELSVVPVGVVEHAQTLRAADLDGDGCHELAVDRGSLPAQVIVLPEATR